MGKIFSCEEINKGWIPKLNDFTVVSDHVKNLLQNNDGVVAASLCGSMVNKSYSIRSDIDCALVYRKEMEKQIQDLLQELVEFADDRNIPLQFIQFRDDIAWTPYHGLQQTFLEHISLSSRSGGNIKGDFESCFADAGRSIKDETRSYIIGRIDKINRKNAELLVMNHDEYHKFLSKLVTVPIHIARKMCRTKGIDFGDDDSKATVLKRYPEMSHADEYAMLIELTEVDAFYSRELKRYLGGIDFCSSYDDLIKKLEKEIPLVREFAYKNLQLL